LVSQFSSHIPAAANTKEVAAINKQSNFAHVSSSFSFFFSNKGGKKNKQPGHQGPHQQKSGSTTNNHKHVSTTYQYRVTMANKQD
jgi:hypothetical protein